MNEKVENEQDRNEIPDIGKVVVLCGSFPPMPCGVGDSAYELARELAGRGIDIEVVTDSKADGVESGQGPFPIHAVVENWGIWATKKIVRAIEELNPDILHIHYPSKAYGKGLAHPFLTMVIRSRRCKFKIITTLHEYRLSHTLRRLAAFNLVDPSDAVVMPCPLELNALTKGHITIDRKINAAIPVGAVGPSPEDLTAPQKEELRNLIRAKWGVAENETVLLHYGIPTVSKGFEVLFKALKILKDDGSKPILVIAGDHRPDENDFHKLLAKQTGGLGIKDRVMWLGRRPIEELPGIFVASDIGVFPFLDGFSFRRSSLTGVLNWDLPIITTEPDGELPEITEQEKVKFVARNDPKALATALINLVENPIALKRMKEAPNPLKELFRWDGIAAQYIDIYRKVLDKE